MLKLCRQLERQSKAGELAVGQVVAVSASGKGAQLAARHIAVIHVLIGPVRTASSNATRAPGSPDTTSAMPSR